MPTGWNRAGVPGNIVTPNMGYTVIATMNGNPATLPEAMRDRFDLFLLADVPAPGALAKLRMSHAGSGEAYATFIANFYADAAVNLEHYSPPVSMRRMLTLANLAARIGEEKAAVLMFGERQASLLRASWAALKKGGAE